MRKREQFYTLRNSYPTLFFFTEGENTEPGYINDIIRDRLSNIKDTALRKKIATCIHINERKTGNDPKTLINDACESAIINNEKYNCFCIFDNDLKLENGGEEFSRLQSAFNKAMSRSIKIIFSNPSFEYWFVLHFENTTMPMNQDEAIKKLNKFFKSYSQDGKRIPYSELKRNESEATKRAQQHRSFDKDLQLLKATPLPQKDSNPNTNADIIPFIIDDFIDCFMKC